MSLHIFETGAYGCGQCTPTVSLGLEYTVFPPLLDFITNIDKFVAAVEEDTAFKPFGEKLSQYRREEEVYEVYKVNATLDLIHLSKIAPLS